MYDVRPLTGDNLDDLAILFGPSKVCSGCWCMWFLLTSREFEQGYAGGNRAGFAKMVAASDTPMGLLAYREDRPVGWCATGPRERYGRLLRSPLLRQRLAEEDGQVWTVPCFYVARAARGDGVTADLIDAAVNLAGGHGASAVESLPLAGPGPHNSMAAFVGAQPMFERAGFAVTGRPSRGRVAMRRTLAGGPYTR